MKTYLYAIAEIHLYPAASQRARLPLDYTVCTPVQFVSDLHARYSLWIVPEHSIFPCQAGKAKVAVLFEEHAHRLLRNGERFTIWFGDRVGGEGVVIEVRTCDRVFYETVFRFSDHLGEYQD